MYYTMHRQYNKCNNSKMLNMNILVSLISSHFKLYCILDLPGFFNGSINSVNIFIVHFDINY